MAMYSNILWRKDTPPDKVAQVLRLLATHVDNLETQKEIINEFTKPNLKF